MTHLISRARILALPLAAFCITNTFHVTAADMSSRLPKAVSRDVNFATEVKPILERSCAQCHSGEKPKGKFSVESRETILKGGDSKDVAIVPGQSGSSQMVQFVADLVHEMEMPPVEKRKKFPPLTANEIAIVRGWIDQGAKWPAGVKLTISTVVAAKEDLAVAAPQSVHNQIFDQIRNGDRRGIAKAINNSHTLEARDEEGNTPLIQAAFYLGASDLAQMIDRGADVNATNNAGETALLKAVWDLDKTRLLIKRGANVNAASSMGNTPLITAAFAHGASDVVKALIAAGAKVEAANGLGGNAVVAAAESGDVKTLRVLLDHHADPNSKTHIVESGAEASALMIASVMGHLDCVKLLLDRGADLNLRTEHGNALNFATFSDRHEVARLLLDRGIDADLAGQRVGSFRKDKGLTPLIYACLTERNAPALAQWLIDRGANVNAKASSGETPLSVARQRGNTKIVAALLAAGAKADEQPNAQSQIAKWHPDEAFSAGNAVVHEAVKSGVTVMLNSGARMMDATGNRCASCHQQSIPAIAAAFAREKGFDYPHEIAKEQAELTVKAAGRFAGIAVEMPLPVPNIAAWYLMGLNASGHQPDAFTDKFAYTLARYQNGDGRWVTKASRAPTDYSDVTSTAAAIRALKLYAPPTMKGRIDRNLAKATTWLRGYKAQSTEERAMQILGLHWAGLGKRETDKLARVLLAEQRADGGWAQLPTLESDAYATGLVMNALRQAEAIPATDPAYRRGVKYLLKEQLADGSWWVKTRVSPVQVAIDDIFPHNKDQWISTVATGWASMALMEAADEKTTAKLTAAK